MDLLMTHIPRFYGQNLVKNGEGVKYIIPIFNRYIGLAAALERLTDDSRPYNRVEKAMLYIAAAAWIASAVIVCRRFVY